MQSSELVGMLPERRCTGHSFEPESIKSPCYDLRSWRKRDREEVTMECTPKDNDRDHEVLSCPVNTTISCQ